MFFKIDLKEKEGDIFFKEFNDENFNSYYSVLFSKIFEGNKYYLNRLNDIKSFYKGKKINPFEYSQTLMLNRENNILLLCELCKSFLNYLENSHRFLSYDKKISNLRLKNDSLKIKINELRLELLENKNANKLLRVNAHNILSRFLVDELIKIMIIKYKDKLDKVSLKLNIILNIIYEIGDDVLLNEDIISSIEKISDEFSGMIKELKENPKDDKLKEKLMNILYSSSKIHFIEDLIIENETFKKEELNNIIDVLFYIKKTGNKTAHPNINTGEYINFKNIILFK